MNPKISVIFPVGERETYLAEALASVLEQTFTDLELLVVLDGVSEPVHDIVKSFSDDRLRVIRQPINMGVSSSRNAGLVAARAPYIALMDSDDVALPERLARQFAWMQAHPSVTVCGTNAVKLFEDGRREPMRYPELDGDIKARLLLVNFALLNPTAMIRADFVREHTLRYDPNCVREEDHQFYVAMVRLGAHFYGLQEELLLYRRHPSNLTGDTSKADEEKTRVRERLLPVYFPELTGYECQVMIKGLCQVVEMTVDEACQFVAVINKAMQETRVFKGENRAELLRILTKYRQRVLQSLH
jgi:glycosyltransferase involved in cell wall biosynthesis